MLRPIRLLGAELHLAVLPLLCFAVMFDFTEYLLLTYAMVFCHEAAHAAAALLLGVRLEKLEILPFGVSIQISGTHIQKPMHEVLIAAAGPVCSGVLAYYFFRIGADDFLVTANAALAAMNLVPALPLDGGRVLKACLTERWGYVSAFNFCIRLTRVCAAAAVLTGGALLYLTGFNFSLMIIGAFLIVNTFAEQRSSDHMMMNEIIRSREKLNRGLPQRAEVIAISARDPARNVLKMLGYNKYCFINVVDPDMNVIGTVTETRLIEQLAEKGIKITAAKMIDFNCEE